MPNWDEVVAAVGLALGGERERGHAQRCVLAHYLADLEPGLDDEVRWDERALTAYAGVRDDDLAAIGIPEARGMAASLHLNLGDGYLRQGNVKAARGQMEAALAQQDALPDDGYGALIRRGLAALSDRIDAAVKGGGDRGVAP